MFISIMSGVIGEVTRQAPATAGSPPTTAHGGARARARARARRSKARAPSTPRATSALPGKYRVLAESFRRAAGFHA